jgi:hypothetical protein
MTDVRLFEETPKGKEVINMRYQKPEVVPLATAFEAIKGTVKGSGGQDVIPSNPAYEADE